MFDRICLWFAGTVIVWVMYMAGVVVSGIVHVIR